MKENSHAFSESRKRIRPYFSGKVKNHYDYKICTYDILEKEIISMGKTMGLNEEEIKKKYGQEKFAQMKEIAENNGIGIIDAIRIDMKSGEKTTQEQNMLLKTIEKLKSEL